MAIGINWKEVWKAVWKAVWRTQAPVAPASRLIQHLNYVVDPQAQATPDYDPPGGVTGGPNPNGGGNGPVDGTDYDPTEAARNPTGRVVRHGGTGAQSVRGRSAGWAWIQTANNPMTAATSSVVDFGPDVTKGHLVLLALASISPTLGATIAISDSLGGTYTQLGDYVRRTDLSGTEHSLALFGAVMPATGHNPVTYAGSVAAGGGTLYGAAMVEYSGNGPTVDVLYVDDNSNVPDTAWTTTDIPVNYFSSLVVGVFRYVETEPAAITPAAGFNGRVTAGFRVQFLDKLNVAAAPLAVAGTVPAASTYLAIGASFRRG